MKKLIALTLALLMALAVFGCKTAEKTEPTETPVPEVVYDAEPFGENLPTAPTIDTPLVVAYSPFSQKFSPFYADTAYDVDAAAMTQITLLTTDRMGGVISNGIEGETVAYNGTDYLYKGAANTMVEYDEATDTTKYTSKLRVGMKFSDGVEVTADDVIFTYYTYLDPSYVGSTTLGSYGILGLQNYQTQTSDEVYEKYAQKAKDIYVAGEAAATDELSMAYWASLKEGWMKDVQKIIDYVDSKYADDYAGSKYAPNYTAEDIRANEGLRTAFGMAMWDFGAWDKTTEYTEDAAGIVGDIDGAGTYKNLWTPTEDVENASFVNAEGVAFVRATAETADADLYYIASTENDVYVTESCAGCKRYTGVDNYSGSFTGSVTGTSWNMVDAFPTLEDYYNETYAAYKGDVEAYAGTESPDGTDIHGAADSAFIAEYGPKDEAMGGEGVKSISGIKKIDKYTVEVTTKGYEAPAVYAIFGIYVTPMHYYGDEAKYDYENGMYGFDFGDLSKQETLTTTPMGAGAYKFIKYDNKVIYYEANEYFYRGCPKIKEIQFKETQSAEVASAVQTGTVDAGEMTGSRSRFEEVQGYNSNGEITGDVISTSKVDNLGYGYIGCNADTVNVGGEPSSEASKQLRKGLATMFAVNRDTAIDSYYGEAASVIQYPISNTSWAAPQPTDEDYRLAFSLDVDGNQIYTADMTAEQKYDAAVTAAIGYLKAAGYTFDEATGMFTAAPEGAAMSYEIIIPADGIGDHPAFAILTATKEMMASIGIELKINDPADSNILWDALDAGTQNFWAAAWGATIDPDMYQVYHSSGVVGEGGSDSNHYHIRDAELDQLIVDARKSDDQSYRKTVYKQCLDIIADWAVEIPTYQRQNCIIFSSERIKMDTVTPDITTFWGWLQDIELIEMA